MPTPANRAAAFDLLIGRLRTLGDVRVTDKGEEVQLVIDKPVDIGAVDDLLGRSTGVVPMARHESTINWHIRLVKREAPRPPAVYRAVNKVADYYEYQFDHELRA